MYSKGQTADTWHGHDMNWEPEWFAALGNNPISSCAFPSCPKGLDWAT